MRFLSVTKTSFVLASFVGGIAALSSAWHEAQDREAWQWSRDGYQGSPRLDHPELIEAEHDWVAAREYIKRVGFETDAISESWQPDFRPIPPELAHLEGRYFYRCWANPSYWAPASLIGSQAALAQEYLARLSVAHAAHILSSLAEVEITLDLDLGDLEGTHERYAWFDWRVSLIDIGQWDEGDTGAPREWTLGEYFVPSVGVGYSNFAGLVFHEAMLSNWWIRGAFGPQSRFAHCLLESTYFSGADLRGAEFVQCFAESSDFSFADLRGASFESTDLADADFGSAQLHGARIELAQGRLPDLRGLSEAEGLDRLLPGQTGDLSSLKRLYEGLRAEGQTRAAREVGASIWRARRHAEDNWVKSSTSDLLRGVVSFIFLDLVCGYGSRPFRPLWILLGLIPLFGMVYAASVLWANRGGLSVIRSGLDVGARTSSAVIPLRSLSPSGVGEQAARALWVGLYFSCLQAFRIGYREATVGEWIERMQPREFRLVGRGWVRTIAGAQSLVGVYLLALFLLCTFGDPFKP